MNSLRKLVIVAVVFIAFACASGALAAPLVGSGQVGFVVIGSSSCGGCAITMDSLKAASIDGTTVAFPIEIVSDDTSHKGKTINQIVQEQVVAWKAQGYDTSAVEAVNYSDAVPTTFMTMGSKVTLASTQALSPEDVQQLVATALGQSSNDGDPESGPKATAVPNGVVGDTNSGAGGTSGADAAGASGDGVSIPHGLGANPFGSSYNFTSVTSVVRSLYNFGLMIGAIIFIVLFLVGGILYLTSTGDEKKRSHAVTLIRDAVIGLILLLSAWAIATWIGRVLGHPLFTN